MPDTPWGEIDFLFAPRDAWLVYLAQGWRLDEPLPDGLPPPHGAYSILLWRPPDARRSDVPGGRCRIAKLRKRAN